MTQHHDSVPHGTAADPTEPALIRADYQGTDLDEVLTLFAGEYGGAGFYAEQTEAPFSYHYTIDGDTEVTLRTSKFVGSIRGTVHPRDEYIVSWLSAGQGLMDIGGDEVRMTVGRPCMFPTGRRYAFHFANFHQNLIHFAAPWLEEVAAERSGTTPTRLHFDHTAVPDAAAIKLWNAAVSRAAAALLGGPSTRAERAEAKLRLAHALLDTFPHEGPTRQELAGPPGNSRLAAALAFIRDHAAEPITTTEVAEAAGLSLRGLQHAFHQQFAVTPSDYLRGVRLDHVRAELLAAHPSESTVSAIAQAWGFAHSGRFSSAYRKRFGEYPAQTLKK